jgi:putative phosphoribosyl transferase
MMVFADRRDAGRRLAVELADLANDPQAIVLGIPRGGVVVAAEIARALRLPLDIFLARKLGVPGQEELAFGAMTADGTRYLDEEIVHATRLTETQIDQITRAAQQLLEERARLYRRGHAPLEVAGKKAILVDDGIATGSSLYAAIRALRTLRPAQVIVAAPVAPDSTSAGLCAQVDRLVCLQTPPYFQAVGQFYSSFQQVTDEEVIEILNEFR